MNAIPAGQFWGQTGDIERGLFMRLMGVASFGYMGPSFTGLRAVLSVGVEHFGDNAAALRDGTFDLPMHGDTGRMFGTVFFARKQFENRVNERVLATANPPVTYIERDHLTGKLAQVCYRVVIDIETIEYLPPFAAEARLLPAGGKVWVNGAEGQIVHVSGASAGRNQYRARYMVMPDHPQDGHTDTVTLYHWQLNPVIEDEQSVAVMYGFAAPSQVIEPVHVYCIGVTGGIFTEKGHGKPYFNHLVARDAVEILAQTEPFTVDWLEDWKEGKGENEASWKWSRRGFQYDAGGKPFTLTYYVQHWTVG